MLPADLCHLHITGRESDVNDYLVARQALRSGYMMHLTGYESILHNAQGRLAVSFQMPLKDFGQDIQFSGWILLPFIQRRRVGPCMSGVTARMKQGATDVEIK